MQTAVTALWRDYPDYCESIFARLAFRHSILQMFGEDDTAQVLDADASHAHEQGREESGYVTSVMAGSFLRKLLDADVDDLAGETAYDPADPGVLPAARGAESAGRAGSRRRSGRR